MCDEGGGSATYLHARFSQGVHLPMAWGESFVPELSRRRTPQRARGRRRRLADWQRSPGLASGQPNEMKSTVPPHTDPLPWPRAHTVWHNVTTFESYDSVATSFGLKSSRAHATHAPIAGWRITMSEPRGTSFEARTPPPAPWRPGAARTHQNPKLTS